MPFHANWSVIATAPALTPTPIASHIRAVVASAFLSFVVPMCSDWIIRLFERALSLTVAVQYDYDFFNENKELVVTSPTALLIPHSFYQSQYVMLRGVNTYSLPSNASLFLTDSLSLNYNAFYKIMFASYPNLHS